VSIETELKLPFFHFLELSKRKLGKPALKDLKLCGLCIKLKKKKKKRKERKQEMWHPVHVEKQDIFEPHWLLNLV